MSNIPEYRVSEISISIKNNLETQFSRIRIKGEVSGLTKANSGHFYFNLKDETALLSSIIWRSKVHMLDVSPEEGMEIVALGKISTYMPRSNYNFIIENIKIAGEGALLKIIEERKKKFKALGYFDLSTKKSIPYLPNYIGIITSSTGAVIEDMKKKIKDRFPSKIILWAVPVQGPKSEKSIAGAIEGFNSMNIKPDVIILARGGGSLEDLMPFNSEIIANAIYKSDIALISAVGHETDFTIADMVSDLRASTPTAAADLVVPNREELAKKINNLINNKKNYLENILNMKSYKLDSFSSKILEPKKYILTFQEKVAAESLKIKNYFFNYFRAVEKSINNINLVYSQKKILDLKNKLSKNLNYFNKSFINFIDKKNSILDTQIEILKSCSYERWLEKGFVIIKDTDNNLIKTVNSLKKNKELIIRFSDGKAETKVTKVSKNK